ncbi:MAG: hypothetical protein J6J23_06655 [Clostridia bacterium]|nr:hypothetical protein [Clostridia bacterium]
MKTKKIIFNVILFILCFVGTMCGVMYSGWAKMNNSNNSNASKIIANENNFLVSLIQNVTTAESLGGDLKLTSESGKTNISGRLELVNDKGLKLKASLNGTFERNKIDLTAFYLSDTLYLSTADLRLAFKVEDVITTLSNIFDGSTGGNLSDLLNMETLQSALTDMETTDLSSGGQKIKLSVPYVGDLQIITNAKSVPIFISATNINLNNDCYNLSINLNSNINPFELDTTIYTEVDVNGYSEIIASIVKIITEGGATFKGTLTTPFATNDIDLELTVNDKLEILLTANIDNTLINILYSNKKIYLDVFDNLLSLTLDDCLNLIDYYFDEKLTLSLIDKNTLQLNTSIGAFTIGLNINETNLDGIYFNGQGFTADLYNTDKVKSISVSTLNAKQVTASDLIATIDKCIDLLSASKYSIEVNGTINNLSVKGNAYVELNKTKSTINNFAFVGKLNSASIELFYTGSYYYFGYNDIKVKFESESVNELYNIFFQKTNTQYVDFETIINFIDETITKIDFSSKSKLSLISGNTEFSVLLRDSMTKINAYNIKLGENLLTVSANIYPNNSNYKAYLSSLSSSDYTDCSKTTDTVKAVTNSAKLSNAKYSGSLSIGIYTYDIFKINIDLKTSYSNGKIKLVANLSNLPISTAVTKYNTLTYKNHKATITIENGRLSIKRTIQKRFSGTTITAIDKTYDFNDIDLTILQDILGLSDGTMKLITKNANGTSTNKINASSLIKGMQVADKSLSILTKSFNALGITDFRANINHDNNYVQSLKIDLAIKDIFVVHAKLEK